MVGHKGRGAATAAFPPSHAYPPLGQVVPPLSHPTRPPPAQVTPLLSHTPAPLLVEVTLPLSCPPPTCLLLAQITLLLSHPLPLTHICTTISPPPAHPPATVVMVERRVVGLQLGELRVLLGGFAIESSPVDTPVD